CSRIRRMPSAHGRRRLSCRLRMGPARQPRPSKRCSQAGEVIMRRLRQFLAPAIVTAMMGASSLAAIAAIQRQNVNSPEWKEELARGFSPYRKLMMEDFPIDDSVTSPYRMVTRSFMHYSYRSHWETSNGFARADVTAFNVRSGFDRNKSWRRSTVPADSPL